MNEEMLVLAAAIKKSLSESLRAEMLLNMELYKQSIPAPDFDKMIKEAIESNLHVPDFNSMINDILMQDYDAAKELLYQGLSQ
jgi:hypothetical protein